MSATRDSIGESQSWRKVRQQYLAQLAEQRASIEQGLDALERSEPDAEKLLLVDLHKLAGSGATFGFAEISQRAAVAEDLFRSEGSGLSEKTRSVQHLLEEVDLALEERAVIDSAAESAPALAPELVNSDPASDTHRSDSELEARPKILIAEDDLIFANLLEQLFGHEVEVHTVHDGKAVIQTIMDIQPAMVLLDDGLPNVSGLDLVEELHTSGLTRDIGIVMLTGNGAATSILRAVRAGAINYMVKPVDPQTLVRAVREQLNKSSSTVLVIDDDPLVQQLVRDGFRAAGYRVLGANDGVRGLDLAREKIPDLIVLDRMMPGLEGGAVLHHLAQDDSTRSIPVIVLTAKAGSGDSMSFLQRGVADFLTKPFNPDELVLRGRRILERKSHA